jgi:hypothetical protein
VIRILWVEPAGHSRGTQQEATSSTLTDSRFVNETFVSKIRWFVVVQTYPKHSLCHPVNTYGGQGVAKSGLNPNDHAALVLDTHEQYLLPGEMLDKQPLHLRLEEKSVKPARGSRIDFSRIYTIEYNIKVATVGRIVSRDIPLLNAYSPLKKNDVTGQTQTASNESETAQTPTVVVGGDKTDSEEGTEVETEEETGEETEED